ncbi:Wzz/FepE/Etk N-terminal domain-containing protein [Chlorobium phaeovibrioides]|uniref:Wzz/FepE/Etk N-terminal domain-containing protein n=1 Tax=Chlorobium phaeovibrioides TaxID=1094 RepID=UPI00123151E1|nr:Wzz/FepE/Etk N-terminal domain-containing protein [Chlorobium phaeovibrioides]QEQ57254.1 lipopolysaccharide biosynthesis protein [Chlorobium phaeovibrioides]
MPDTSELTDNSHFQRPDPYDDEISLLDLAITLAKHKKLIIGLPLAVAIVTAVVTLFMPATYTATTTVLPRGGDKNILVSLVESQPMGDSLVVRLDLQSAYGVSSLRDARASLAAATSVKAEKDGTLQLEVDDSSPERAAAIANAYPVVLRELTGRFIHTPAAERRMLFEKQLPDAEKMLEDARAAMQEVQAAGQSATMNAGVASLVKTASELKARIAMKEVELVVIGSIDESSFQDGLPRQQLNALWEELAAVENNTAFISKVSLREQAYIRAVGALKYAETRLEGLRRQIDLAKVAEQRQAPMIQVLNRADVPLDPSKPQRSKIVLIAALAAGFLAVLWAFVVEALRSAAEDSEQQSKIKQLKESLGWQ